MNSAGRSASMRVPVALLAGVAVSVAVSSCGSGGAGTVAEQARTIASTAAAQVGTGSSSTPRQADPARTVPERTASTPASTTTVTAPSRTVTATRTTSVTQQSTVTNVVVAPASTTSDASGGDGMPWWGWLLIALGVAGIAVGMFVAGRRRGTDASGGPAPARSEGDGSDPPEPPRP